MTQAPEEAAAPTIEEAVARARDEGIIEGRRQAAAMCETAALGVERGRKRMSQTDRIVAATIRELGESIHSENTGAYVVSDTESDGVVVPTTDEVWPHLNRRHFELLHDYRSFQETSIGNESAVDRLRVLHAAKLMEFDEDNRPMFEGRPALGCVTMLDEGWVALEMWRAEGNRR